MTNCRVSCFLMKGVGDLLAEKPIEVCRDRCLTKISYYPSPIFKPLLISYCRSSPIAVLNVGCSWGGADKATEMRLRPSSISPDRILTDDSYSLQ